MHSPFIFALVTKCFYDRHYYEEYEELKSYRAKLLKNKNSITITDLGSGSKVFKTDRRYIDTMAKTSGSSLKQSKLLFRMVRFFNPGSVLELGTNLGIGTHAMALGNPRAKITSIEGCKEILKVANTSLSNAHVRNFATHLGNFKDVIPKLPIKKWDLIFFDGHHSKEATLQYFEQLLPFAHNDSIFIFDDIYWSKDMADTWNIIKNHPKTTVTVDIFQWGIVFFRKEQRKEHFKIRV